MSQKFLINSDFFFAWRWGGSSTQAWMPTYVSILRIPQMIWVWRATVEWYWQGKTEELGEKPVPVPLCPQQIPHGLTQARTRASAVRVRRLTTWAMARPFRYVTKLLIRESYLTLSKITRCNFLSSSYRCNINFTARDTEDTLRSIEI
jgi:hypothetical protein